MHLQFCPAFFGYTLITALGMALYYLSAVGAGYPSFPHLRTRVRCDLAMLAAQAGLHCSTIAVLLGCLAGLAVGHFSLVLRSCDADTAALVTHRGHRNYARGKRGCFYI